MVNLKPKNQQEQEQLADYDYKKPRQHLILFILASVLLHSLGVLIIALSENRPVVKEKKDNQPIEFVIVPPEETKPKPPPETNKRAIRDSVAKPTTQAKKNIIPEEIAKPIAPAPKPTPPASQPPTSTPQSTPAPKDDAIATKLPAKNNQTQKTTPSPPNPIPKTGAAGLLGGYQKSLDNGGNEAFFSPEALAYKKVLSRDQLNALKDIDLSQYFAEIKRRVKSNWHPSYAVEEYTTFLTFEIQKSGQVTNLKVSRSSGSQKVDQESLTAVQKSAPFDPLPPEFPLAALEVEFTFNIYIY
ncbi:hypothetical protein NIES4102_02800 [Chondrocystis sp. NIES-4102]|nr:hypothetical protein NIES4102_02800 [Chondrocystis sp. NIES-4102]